MLSYLAVPGVPKDALAAGIVRLWDHVLPGRRSGLAARLERAHDPWGLVALDGDDVIGFKLGYSDRPGRFYSWLGGVAPEYRRQGIAAELMRRQHERCVAAGYTRIRTHTTNDHKPMLLLNIRSGFDIIGVTASPDRGVRIVLERALP
ncbi:MAG: GNAT family N-acetyltransferase [Myxococcota bacterium]